jgi:hypothetical protein
MPALKLSEANVIELVQNVGDSVAAASEKQNVDLTIHVKWAGDSPDQDSNLEACWTICDAECIRQVLLTM